jgi:Protein of unknown function (DUF2505)
MSMTFDFKQNVDKVFQLLTDPDFLVERNLALGDIESDCETEDDADQTVVRMTRKLKREIPRILAKMFDPVQSMELEEIWHRDDDGWRGDYQIKIIGQPVTLGASFSLKANGKGARYTISHRCKAKIPLVGGKVEKMVLSQTESGATEELEYARKKLK